MAFPYRQSTKQLPPWINGSEWLSKLMDKGSSIEERLRDYLE
jgi:hypothetical protein